jgi:phage baseplate assembly protein W
VNAYGHLKKDLRVVFDAQGQADLVLRGDLELVDGRDTLGQALKLRLLTWRGDLGPLGHRRYGSRVHELVGRRMENANVQLLRRLVRQAVREDPRVAEVVQVRARPRADVPGLVTVQVRVRPVAGDDPIDVEVDLDAG